MLPVYLFFLFMGFFRVYSCPHLTCSELCYMSLIKWNLENELGQRRFEIRRLASAASPEVGVEKESGFGLIFFFRKKNHACLANA